MPIQYEGLISGSLELGIYWELDPDTGLMYTYGLPLFGGFAASDSSGRYIAYPGTNNLLYVFDRYEKIAHLIGNATILLYYISWGTAYNLMLSGDGVEQDNIYFSGLNLLDDGSYQREDSALIRLLPVQIPKTPYAAGGGDTAGLTSRVSETENVNTSQDALIITLQQQIADLETVQTGLETFPTQNALDVGDLYYKSNDTTFVSSSPAASETAKYRGIVWKIAGGTITGVRAGSPLTAEQITALNVSGLALNSYQDFYMGADGRPDIEPPTEIGYEIKKVISSGRLQGDSQGTVVGEEVYKTVVVTTSDLDTIEPYLERKTIVGNSGSAIARTPTDGTEGQQLVYINKGAGNLTITGTFSGATNIVLAQNASQVLEFHASEWWKI
jgi:hypothetical protein